MHRKIGYFLFHQNSNYNLILKLIFQFVCVGGSPRRMEKFANFMLDKLDLKLPAGQQLINIAKATDRYALYKVGPVLAASVSISVF